MAARNGSVHVATIIRRYNGKVYKTYLLRRTYRQGKKVLHETLGNLSHLPEATIDLIRRSLKGETFVSTKDAFRTLRSLPHGHVEAVLRMIRKLGLDTLIASKPCRQRDLVLAMIVQRILFPCSKLATTRDWHTTTLAEELARGRCRRERFVRRLGLAADAATVHRGEACQAASGRGRAGALRREQQLLRRADLPLAKFGHNRDGKQGRPIIVYGMLTDCRRPAGGGGGLSGQHGRPDHGPRTRWTSCASGSAWSEWCWPATGACSRRRRSST